MALLLIICRADQQERSEYEKRRSHRHEQTAHIGPNCMLLIHPSHRQSTREALARIGPAAAAAAVPATASGTEAIGRIRFAVAGIPAGTLRLKIALVATSSAVEPGALREAEAVRYRRAYIS